MPHPDNAPRLIDLDGLALGDDPIATLLLG
jgi:hypothetical protein